jgi:putative phage-type endonuclease
MTTYHPEKNKSEWLVQRKRSIGGSESSAILGCDQYRSPLDIYIDKTTERVDEINNGYMWLGTVLEEPIAERYMDETGRKMRRQPFKVHPDFPFMSCTLDRQIVGDERGVGVWECKTASPYLFRDMKLNGLPEKYIIQVQHNMCVWNYKWGAICVLNRDTGEMIHFDIDRDDELISVIVEKLGLFWHGHIVPRIAPEPIAVKVVKLPPVGGEITVINNDDWFDACSVYSEAKALQSDAKMMMDMAKAKIIEHMDASDASTSEGSGMRFYYKPNKGRLTTDMKKLQADNPDINLDEYQNRGSDFMSLRAFEIGDSK